MQVSRIIDRVDSEPMDELCAQLAAMAPELEQPGAWPAQQLDLCGRSGVYRWFMPEAVGGLGWSDADQTRAYLRLAAACQTVTFVITQRMGACRRVAVSQNEAVHQRWLGPLLAGDCFATVGISHLTTSRRHLKRPVLRATPEAGGAMRIDGYSPWVTGGAHAEMIVVGATLEDGREILAAVPTDLSGVQAQPPVQLVALTASHTGRVDFDNVLVSPDQLIAGPIENVMQQGSGAGTGGLQTSTLAAGLAAAAVGLITEEAGRRDELREIADELASQVAELHNDLIAASSGDTTCSLPDLRGRANRLVLRTTQAALTAAKGAGFVAGHPAGRWCREALFYLVWSCPQPVTQAHLCELAGIAL